MMFPSVVWGKCAVLLGCALCGHVPSVAIDLTPQSNFVRYIYYNYAKIMPR